MAAIKLNNVTALRWTRHQISTRHWKQSKTSTLKD